MNDRLRIGDADREAAARELGEHFAQGRITSDEHAERLERIWTAKTEADLAPAFADLPRPRPAPADRPSSPRSGSWLSSLTPVPFLLKALVVLVVLAVVFSHWSLLVVAAALYLFGIRRLWMRNHRYQRHPHWR